MSYSDNQFLYYKYYTIHTYKSSYSDWLTHSAETDNNNGIMFCGIKMIADICYDVDFKI